MGYKNISTRTGKPVKSKEELAARIDAKLREMKLHSGPDEFDPVLLCAIIAAESYDSGDLAMALAAAREVAQYVRPKLQAVQLSGEVTIDVDVEGAKDRFLALARQFPLEDDNLVEAIAIRGLED
jgi:hypothetical protein